MLRRELLGDDVDILIDRGGALQELEVARQCGWQSLLHLRCRGRGGVRVEVEQQVPGVLRNR